MTIERKALRVLNKANDELTVRDVAARMGIPYHRAHKALTRLLTSGEVKRRRRGRWGAFNGPGTGSPPHLYRSSSFSPGIRHPKDPREQLPAILAAEPGRWFSSVELAQRLGVKPQRARVLALSQGHDTRPGRPRYFRHKEPVND